ncbi:MAG: hypothetical protein CMH50_08185 [Myxococcales bacterium]|nr:hypothetical protein [Myxococcales bacterium]
MEFTVRLALILSLLPLSAQAGPGWDAYTKKNRYHCPGKFKTLESPEEVKFGKYTYTVNGSHWTVNGPLATKGKIVAGVLSALKDPSDGTQKHVEIFAGWFRKQRVDLVIANGDLALNEFDLEAVMEIIGKNFKKIPVLMLPGNSESRTSFNRTVTQMAKKYPNFINGAMVRRLDWNKHTFWTLPGYHDKRFFGTGSACKYKEDHTLELSRKIDEEPKRNHILVAHGPPKAKGNIGLDRIMDGTHVGDQKVTDLIQGSKIKWGIFGHILESGGTVATNFMKRKAAASQKLSSLYFNAGSACNFPMSLRGGKDIRGMAAVTRIGFKKSSVIFNIQR